MKRKLTTYLGLALVVAVGAMAALAAFTFTATPQLAEATVSDSSTGIIAGGPRDSNLISPQAITSVTLSATGAATAVSPNDPGVPSRFELRFVTSPTGVLNPGAEIIMTLDDDFQVAPSLVTNLITISSSGLVGGGSPNQTVRPDGVTVSLVGPENDQAEIRLIVPDMDTSDATGGGGQGIAGGATVTVIFQQGSGITNPSEAGAFTVNVRTTADAFDFGYPAANRPVFPARVSMDTNGDPRGSKMTAVAYGVENGTTVTYWHDADGDGVRDSSERDLCNAVSTSADVATCVFTIANPPFFPGFGTTITDTDSDGVINSCDVDIDDDGILNVNETTPPNTPNTPLSGCNFVNFQDGESITSINGPDTDTDGAGPDTDTDAAVFGPRSTGFPRARAAITQAEVTRQNFELEPTIDVQPRLANTGDTVTVSVYDFAAGDVLNILRLAGITVTPATTFPLTIPTSGQTTFSFIIPGVGPTGCVGTACVRIPTGVQRIEVFSTGGADQDLNITIGGAKLSTSHKDVIGNQDLTITGSGFSDTVGGVNACIRESGNGTGGIFLNNVALEIDDDNDCPTGIATGIELTGGGTFTLTVIVRDVTTGGVPTALLTPGSVELKVIDTNGAEGTILVNIPNRTIDVTPKSSRPRDSVTITGKSFIADNPDGADATVRVEYSCGANETRTATADPDVSGNWSEVMQIPSDCTIPSTNTIKAEIFVGGTNSGVVSTITHSIPEAVVVVAPTKGKSGDRITITGDGFRTFDTVEKIEIGGRGTLGGRTVNTDDRGAFSVSDLVVPGLDPGIHSVIVEVGTGADRTTASGTYEVVSDVPGPGVPPTGTTPIATALVTPLGVDFVRSFNFNNQSKVWTFYDARPEFKDINTLKDVTGGQVYWVNVLNDKPITFCGRSITLYKGWNQVPC